MPVAINKPPPYAISIKFELAVSPPAIQLIPSVDSCELDPAAKVPVSTATHAPFPYTALYESPCVEKLDGDQLMPPFVEYAAVVASPSTVATNTPLP